MVRFEVRSFHSELQRQLDREAQSTREFIPSEDPLQVTSKDAPAELFFGPYSVSPLSGLHFDNADDTAAS